MCKICSCVPTLKGVPLKEETRIKTKHFTLFFLIIQEFAIGKEEKQAWMLRKYELNFRWIYTLDKTECRVCFVFLLIQVLHKKESNVFLECCFLYRCHFMSWFFLVDFQSIKEKKKGENRSLKHMHTRNIYEKLFLSFLSWKNARISRYWLYSNE